MTEGTVQPTYVPFTLTAGKPESYPFKLQTLLAARYTAQTVDVFNGGRGGEKTADGILRLRDVVAEAQPQAVLLMDGANDLNDPVLSLDVTSITSRMEDMIRDTSGRGIDVFLATIPPQRLGGQRAAAAGLVDKYNSQLKVMAAKRAAILVDVNALLPLSLIGQDGLHPTEAGYQALAEIFQSALQAKYEASASVTAVRR